MLNFFRKNKEEQRTIYSQSGFLSLFGQFNYKATNNPTSIPLAYRAVTLIASQIAKTKLTHVKDINLNEAVKGSHLSNILRTPNDNLTKFDVFSSLIRDILLTGNGFLWKYEKKLYAIPSDAVSLVNHNNITDPIAYIITYQGQSINVNAEDMIHVKNPLTTEEGYWGVSPIATFYGVFSGYDGIAKTGENFLNNSASISGVIETDNKLTAEVVTDLKENFSKAFSGSKNAGKTPILPNGLKYKQLNPITDADLNLLEKKKASIEDISLIFGVPLQILGMAEGTYSNMEQIYLAFQNYTLEPIAEAIAQELTLKLIPSIRKDAIVFEFDNLAFASVADKASATSLLLNSGILTQNESRKIYGMETLDTKEANTPKNIHEEAIEAKTADTSLSTKDKMLPATESTQNKSSAYNNSRSLAHLNTEETEKEIARLKSHLGRLK